MHSRTLHIRQSPPHPASRESSSRELYRLVFIENSNIAYKITSNLYLHIAEDFGALSSFSRLFPFSSGELLDVVLLRAGGLRLNLEPEFPILYSEFPFTSTLLKMFLILSNDLRRETQDSFNPRLSPPRKDASSSRITSYHKLIFYVQSKRRDRYENMREHI